MKIRTNWPTRSIKEPQRQSCINTSNLEHPVKLGNMMNWNPLWSATIPHQAKPITSFQVRETR